MDENKFQFQLCRGYKLLEKKSLWELASLWASLWKRCITKSIQLEKNNLLQRASFAGIYHYRLNFKQNTGQNGGPRTAYWHLNHIFEAIPKVMFKVMSSSQSNIISQCDAQSEVASQSNAKNYVFPEVVLFLINISNEFYFEKNIDLKLYCQVTLHPLL